MTRSKLKIGTTLMMVMGVYTLVISISWALFTEIGFVSDFLAFTGVSYADYLAASPVFGEMYIITKRMIGICMCIAAIQILFITQKSYAKGEKWAWVALLISGSSFWGMLIGYRIYIGYVAPSMVTFILGAVLFILGILLPAKEFLGKKEQDIQT
jgi:hypothetical protein